MAECPYCGVETQASHDSQDSCIAALRAEIARLRAVLSRLRSTAVRGPAEPELERPARNSDDTLDA